MATSLFSMLAVIVFALFAFASVTAASESESHFVVAHKKASLVKLNSSSERITVSIDVYNHGSYPIYDVSLTDDNWSSEIFDFVAGNTSKIWEGLDAGAHVSHSFELESKVKATYYSAPAVITFRIPTSSKSQKAYSTPISSLETLAEKAVDYKLDWAKKLLTKYGSHVSVVLIIVLFVQLLSSPSKSNAAKKKQ